MSKTDDIRVAAEGSLVQFIKLVAPHRVLGAVHEELIGWWTRQNAKTHQLTLLPRAHQKSILIAYRVAWEITKNPAVTVLYISATANLAEKQLKAIKDILTSNIYRRYWPDMVHKEEGKREKWSVGEIAVDHPKRALEGVRDPTVFTAGLTTSITGLHSDINVLDDVVVPENAYTMEGRGKVETQYSLLASIANPGAQEWAVGTRYHPKDLYNAMLEMREEIYNISGDIIDMSPVYETFERRVEDHGDGTGQFLWPRQQRADGSWFGFNTQILAKKRAQYLDRTQFRAQYYNDPNVVGAGGVSPDNFLYYDKRLLQNEDGFWYYNNNRLNVFAAIDFAFSMKKKADYTAIAVIGMDVSNNIFILDIDRFKTEKIMDYFDAIARTYSKWGYRKIRAEVTVAQQAIVRELKESYIKPNGLLLKVDEYRPRGNKEERIAATLEPRYANQMIYHYKGGNCQVLEEELIMAHPPHDDVKDALTAAIDIAVAPQFRATRAAKAVNNNVLYHSRFGGVKY